LDREEKKVTFLVVVESSLCIGKDWGRALGRQSSSELPASVMEVTWHCLGSSALTDSFHHQSVPLLLPTFHEMVSRIAL